MSADVVDSVVDVVDFDSGGCVCSSEAVVALWGVVGMARLVAGVV